MIAVENISISYSGRPVVRDVSFDLRDGEIIALIGPNGVGKTTLIRALNQTVEVKSGSIKLEDRDIRDFSRREIAQRIAVVAQENETKFPLTVLEFVLAGRFVHGSAFGWETEQDVDTARRALGDCELADLSGRLMNALSGGARQR